MKTCKKIILVDMDDTLVDNSGAVNEYLKSVGINVDYKNRDTFEDTDIKLSDGRHLNTFVRQALNQPGFFLNLKPLPGAIEALKEMDQEYEVKICTAPLRTYDPCVTEKFGWVEKNLGKEWTKKIIIIKDKTFARGHILIDDRDQTSEAKLSPEWIQVYFTQQHNRKFPGPRLDSWANWRQVIEPLLETPQKISESWTAGLCMICITLLGVTAIYSMNR